MVDINLRRIKRIVSFGCSFTSGCELLDRTLDKKYVELKPQISAFEWYNVISKDPEAFKQLNENREKEKFLAWPAKLSKNLGKDFYSYAMNGNSNEKMLWQIEKAIHDGDISDTDLVLVGITSAQRSMAFDPDNKEPIPFLLADSGFIKPRYKESLYTWFDDSRILWNYIRDLEHFNRLKDRLNGRLFLVHMEFPFRVGNNHYWNLTELGYQQEFFKQRLDEILNSDLFIDRYLHLYEFAVNKLAHGHPDEKAHQWFADALAKLFKLE